MSCHLLPSGMQRQTVLPLAHLAQWSGPTPLGASCSRSRHLGWKNVGLTMTGDCIPDPTCQTPPYPHVNT